MIKDGPVQFLIALYNTSILPVRCYGDIFQKYKNSYFHVKNKEIKIKII
jgi:hypothetical protein